MFIAFVLTRGSDHPAQFKPVVQRGPESVVLIHCMLYVVYWLYNNEIRQQVTLLIAECYLSNPGKSKFLNFLQSAYY